MKLSYVSISLSLYIYIYISNLSILGPFYPRKEKLDAKDALKKARGSVGAGAERVLRMSKSRDVYGTA